MKSRDILEHMFEVANAYYNSGDYKAAYDGYMNIIKLEYHAGAYYNLGILSVTGRGVKRNFFDAAKYFRMAEMLGDENAANMRMKVRLDYTAYLFDVYREDDIYDIMLEFAAVAEPERPAKAVANEYLCGYGNYMMQTKKDYDRALKAYRVGTIYGGHSDCAYNAAIIYFYGYSPTEKQNIPAALYWFDKCGDADALRTRDNILDNYTKQNGAAATRELLECISMLCVRAEHGVPRDAVKDRYWADMSRKYA